MLCRLIRYGVAVVVVGAAAAAVVVVVNVIVVVLWSWSCGCSRSRIVVWSWSIVHGRVVGHDRVVLGGRTWSCGRDHVVVGVVV